jgi:hypothetical protein
VETKTNKIMERELRIGNLVLTTDVLIPYHRIEPEDLVSMKDGSFKKLGIEIKPIPLTEDIVKKIFTKEEVLDDYILDVGNSRVLTYSVKADVFSLYFIKREGRVELNFLEVLIFEGLHDLQNWYYYNNSKTELEINL